MTSTMRIGRYLAQRPIGAGSFATVWLVYDELLETQAAAKVLADNWSRNADVRRRFIDEARFLRRIDHERVVRVHEVDHLPDGRPYFVMNWADRGSLEQKMRRGAFVDDPAAAIQAAIEMCRCLAVVHDEGLVHRDVKPSNVLFRSVRAVPRRGAAGIGVEQMLLGDFGLAKDVAAGSGLTMAAGTPQYMAPEQAVPAASIDGRADVFSVAAVLYELVTGAPAFPLSGISGVRHERPARPVALVDAGIDLPPGLQEALDRGLATDPEDRYPTVHHLAAGLQVVLDDLLVSGRLVPRSRLNGAPGLSAIAADLIARAHTAAVDDGAELLVRLAAERLATGPQLLVMGAGEAGSSELAWELAGVQLSPLSAGGHGLLLMRLAGGASELATVWTASGSRLRQPVVEDVSGRLSFDLGTDPFSVSRVEVTLARDELRHLSLWDAPDERAATTLLPTVDLVLVAFSPDLEPEARAAVVSGALQGAVAGPLVSMGFVPRSTGSVLGDPYEHARALSGKPAVRAVCGAPEVVDGALVARLALLVEALGARAEEVSASAVFALLRAALTGGSPGRDALAVLDAIAEIEASRPPLAELALLRRATAGASALPPVLLRMLPFLLLCRGGRNQLGMVEASASEVRTEVERRIEQVRTLTNNGRIPFAARRDAAVVESALVQLWNAPVRDDSVD